MIFKQILKKPRLANGTATQLANLPYVSMFLEYLLKCLKEDIVSSNYGKIE